MEKLETMPVTAESLKKEVITLVCKINCISNDILEEDDMPSRTVLLRLTAIHAMASRATHLQTVAVREEV